MRGFGGQMPVRPCNVPSYLNLSLKLTRIITHYVCTTILRTTEFCASTIVIHRQHQHVDNLRHMPTLIHIPISQQPYDTSVMSYKTIEHTHQPYDTFKLTAFLCLMVQADVSLYALYSFVVYIVVSCIYGIKGYCI